MIQDSNFSVPKAVAFQVNLEGQETENLILKHPPLKLKVKCSLIMHLIKLR